MHPITTSATILLGLNGVGRRFLRAGFYLAAMVLMAAQGNVKLRGEGPVILEPNLEVRTVVDGLVTPTTMAFLGPDDFLVMEKNTGRVQRIQDGQSPSTVLELPVNTASERGMLGIALHPHFPDDPGVYLYWTESLSGTISSTVSDVPLLGNRVDRFEWDGEMLTFSQNLIQLRAWQKF